jgi:radical SAM protein with 4Fe4S-binding SPASM domain
MRSGRRAIGRDTSSVKPAKARTVSRRAVPSRSLWSTSGFRTYEQWHLPRLAAEYLKRCDGKTTHGQICEALPVPFRQLLDDVATDLAEQTGVIRPEAVPSSPSGAGIFVTGDFDSFAPLHMSVEITDSCNFTCDHCYVSASPLKQTKRGYEALLDLFDTMWTNGVKVVEITGGECTTHPHFRETLAAAAKKFHLVAVISNGYLLGTRDGLADWVGQFDNVCVQISVDGMQRFHDVFRKKAGSFSALCEAARRLKQNGVMLRLAMSVTPDNIDQVEEVFLLAKELGADVLSVAAITSFGRGASLGMCAEKDHELQREISRRLSPYAEDPLFEANRISMKLNRETKQINCGAGWRTFGLNGATGEVRSCLFLADSKKFGSVDRDHYADIFRSEYMAMFRNAPSPSSEVETCRHCSYLPSCRGCFAKAFRVSETEYPECPWRKKYFPGMQLSMADAPRQGCGVDAPSGGGRQAITGLQIVNFSKSGSAAVGRECNGCAG